MKKIRIFFASVAFFLPIFASAAFPLYLQIGKCMTVDASESLTFTVFVDMKCVMKKTDCAGALLVQEGNGPGALGINTRVSTQDGGTNIDVIMMSADGNPGVMLKFNTVINKGAVKTISGLQTNLKCSTEN
ncbi:MAG: hypothetical protein A2Z20_10665 [Bdellovibrionales bacterium RBG_16_40_8]|nr:MAG: hypothetical protein A2Z20_10665 [Bdellovibrionales bacterium RBG_16_40_8]